MRYHELLESTERVDVDLDTEVIDALKARFGSDWRAGATHILTHASKAFPDAPHAEGGTYHSQPPQPE